MPFIRSFNLLPDREHPWPYNIAAVRYATELVFDPRITILVGDNGTGKSTLLETLGAKIDLPLIGGMIRSRRGFDAAKILSPFMHLHWGRQTSKGFFFRAEDFSDFIASIEREQNKIRGDLRDLEGNVPQSIIDNMTESANHQLRLSRQQYGDDLQAFSHGEAYLQILHTRIQGKGMYLLDEPEAALSPLKQLSLIFFIMERLRKGDAQFVIATHSPIIMGFPGARLYQILETGMEQVAFHETDHYSITRNFLNNPEAFFREDPSED